MDQQIKEIQNSILEHHKMHRDTVEKHGAEIKTIKETVKALETGKLAEGEANEKLKKINTTLKTLEDKLTTLQAQREADKRYNTEDGLADFMSKGDHETPSEMDFKKIAKSILKDPFAKSYKAAFMKRVADPYDRHGSSKNLLLAIDEIKKSSVDSGESFIKKTLTTIVGEEAGYFCPPELDLEIQKTLFETSPIRRVATVRNTTRGHYEFPIRTTLPTAVWTETELDALDDTANQKYQMGKIPVNKLSALPSISLDMLEDSVINIEAELRSDLKEAFMLAENKAFIDGDGINRPTGILEYAKNGAANYDVSKPLRMAQVELDLSNYQGADGGIHLADHLLDLNAKLLAPYKRRAVYTMSRGIKNVVRQIKDKQNQYLFSMGQNWGGFPGVPKIMDGMNGRINGYPILECDDLPQTLKVDEYPIQFGDFSKYIILDRIGLRLIKDEITKKGFVIYWFRKRTGAGFKFLQGVVTTKVVA